MSDLDAASLSANVRKRKPARRCPTCLSRIDWRNPYHPNGGCAWCNGDGDYSD